MSLKLELKCPYCKKRQVMPSKKFKAHHDNFESIRRMDSSAKWNELNFECQHCEAVFIAYQTEMPVYEGRKK